MIRTLFLSLALTLAACGASAPLALPCPLDVQWTPCPNGIEAVCWRGTNGVCANGDETTCGKGGPYLNTPLVECETLTAVVCVEVCSS